MKDPSSPRSNLRHLAEEVKSEVCPDGWGSVQRGARTALNCLTAIPMIVVLGGVLCWGMVAGASSEAAFRAIDRWLDPTPRS